MAINGNKMLTSAAFLRIEKSLKQHIHRTKYQVAIWGRPETPLMQVPSAGDGHRWMKEDDDSTLV